MASTTDVPVHETFQLGEATVPRLWTGLWQLSSNAWGTAPVSKIRQAMGRHVDSGYTTFADHYGSAELIFGQFRSSLKSPQSVFGATKWCVFKPTVVSQETVEAAIRQRIERMQTDRVDLLQFHWQDYENPDYLKAIEIMMQLKARGLIRNIGLCNFDAVRTNEICSRFPAAIVSNQIPFSVVDTRALYALKDVCDNYGIKALTYGTLCGGFLAEKWIGLSEPDHYSGSLNPSQRKYLDMIVKAWGSWALFQELLVALHKIAQRHSVNVSNVATRWVLDHSFVGAVIVGARLGCSEYPSDNLKVYDLVLTDEDRLEIQSVLNRSSGPKLIETIGDCGAEYR
ncbi:NADP-dependent oxidoreductase domain-containing protein [Favolaschia claudopus]|uniref:NADP-dependent oxidoreductase domain-containing protein n=1 Tax=Favolaschia claudopus TaxID=2862362 RepID=A0AAW0AYJ5_9AGAR